MSPGVEAELLAASQPLRVPGQGDMRVLSQGAVQRIAAQEGVTAWEIEAAALEAGVAPIHYLRNLSRFGFSGQIRLLRSSVCLVGDPRVTLKIAARLAQSGVGRFVLIPSGDSDPPTREPLQPRAEAEIRSANRSAEVSIETADLKRGDVRLVLKRSNVAIGLLAQAMEEQLLEFACKVTRVPLVLGGVDGMECQALTVLPGESGVALVYRPTQSHIRSQRSDALLSDVSVMMVAGWVAEQAVQLLLGEGALLAGRLRYAHFGKGEMVEAPLRGSEQA